MKTNAPPFSEFERRYFEHLNARDRPSCFIAYIRAEADHMRDHGIRRFKTYQVFRNAMHRAHKKRKRVK